MEKIVNRIEKSGLLTLDLADYFPKGKRSLLDIKDFLWQGMVLKEKDFRLAVSNYNWEQYQDHFVALTCSEDTIIANWAYMIIVSKLDQKAKKVIFGTLENLENCLFDETLNNLNLDQYRDKKVLIKGCGSTPIPTFAYAKIVTLLQPVVKSLMYGEACSSVPIFKKSIHKKS